MALILRVSEANVSKDEGYTPAPFPHARQRAKHPPNIQTEEAPWPIFANVRFLS